MRVRFSPRLYACAGVLVVAGAISGVGSATVHAAGPTVSSITPNSGSTEGDTHVTIAGSGFTGATAIQFGSTSYILKTTPCPTTIPPDGCFTVSSDTSIDAYTMSHPAGTVTVLVTGVGGQSTGGPTFTYNASQPVQASLDVQSGTGGTAVTISPVSGGQEASAYDWATSVNFVPPSGPTIHVTQSCSGFAGPQGCFDVAGDLIKMKTPSVPASDLGTTYDVTVTTAGGVSPIGSSDQFTFERAFDTVDVYGGIHAVSGTGYLPLGSSGFNFGFNIARGVALVPGSINQGFVLDGWGGVHPFGGVLTQPAVSGYWKGWDIARGIVVQSGGTGGYVLDGYGGLHPFGTAKNGGAPAVSGYWNGWDIARGVTINADGHGGYVLDGYGGLHPWGTAMSIATPAISAYWPGWNIARGVASNLDDAGGYVVDGFGGVHRWGTAPVLSGTAYWSGWDIARAVVVTPDSIPASQGGYVLDGFGGLHAFGNAPSVTPSYYTSHDVVHMMATV